MHSVEHSEKSQSQNDASRRRGIITNAIVPTPRYTGGFEQQFNF